MAEASGKAGAVYMQTGAATPITGEALGTGDETTFDTANANVDEDSLIVYMDASPLPKGDYTVSVKGRITFVAAPGAGGNAITADYDYYSVTQVAGFFNWSLNSNADVLDTTDFDSGGEREYIASLTGFDVSAAKHWISEAFITAYYPGQKFIIKCYTDTGASTRYEGWAIITGVSTNCAVDALIDEAVTLQGTGLLKFEST